jgi:hypothetical protein
VCAETLLQEKQVFLERARTEDVIVCFQHDADVPACRVTLSERGHYAVREAVGLN